jgi:predicted ATPase
MRLSRCLKGPLIRQRNCVRINIVKQSTASTEPTVSSESLKIALTPLASYNELVLNGDISEDIHQLAAVQKLQLLYNQILLIDSTLSASTSTSVYDSFTIPKALKVR